MSIKYTKELLQDAVDNSQSMMGVLRYLGLRQAGGTQAHVARRVKEFELDTSHFNGKSHNRGKPSLNRLSSDQVLILRTDGKRTKRPQLKRAMLEVGFVYQCSLCKIGPEWNGLPLIIEIDHINGEWTDNRVENLRFLCPNCHSQQETTNQSWKFTPNKVDVAQR